MNKKCVEMVIFQCNECGMYIAVDDDSLEEILGNMSCFKCGAYDTQLDFITVASMYINKEEEK